MMVSDIKISIIIPVYDVEDFIEECICSISNQSLKELEIICIDDGSTDGTVEIIEKCKQGDERITIIKQEHAGVSVARNAGIDASVGEYLYFMDSDDYIVEDMLAILYEEVKKDDLDDICFNADAVYESEELEETFPTYKELYYRPGIYEDVVTGRELFTKLEENKNYTPVPWLHMVKRELIINNNIRFFPGIPHGDNLFSMEVYLVAERVKHISQSLYRRRVREGSISTKEKAFINSYGYFSCITAFVKFAKNHPSLSEEERKAFMARCVIMQGSAITIAMKLEAEELEQGISELPFEVQLEYSAIIQRVMFFRRKAAMNKNKYEKLKNSKTYRLGNALLFIPRKVMSIFKK